MPESAASPTAMMAVDPPLPKPAALRPLRRWRDGAVMAGLGLLFLGGLIGLAAATGWRETLAQMARLQVWQVAALLGFSLVNYLFRALRWHLFARSLGLATGIVQNTRHYIGGFAMIVTPARVGELVRMRWITRETGWSFDRAMPLVLVDRAGDLAAMALILALSVSLAAGGVAGAVPVTLFALGAAVTATRPRLLAAATTLGYRSTGLMPRLFARIRRAARSLDRFSDPRVLLAAIALGCAGWFAEAWGFHLLLVWMGAEIGLWKAVAIFVFATLAGGLTGSPGGVGGAEAAMIALLTLDGVPLEAAVAATAIIRLTTLWFALLIGMAVFPFAERISLKGRHALEIR
jgi:glycosyltransferase 2 family protein